MVKQQGLIDALVAAISIYTPRAQNNVKTSLKPRNH
jgi:hypothetical protein